MKKLNLTLTTLSLLLISVTPSHAQELGNYFLPGSSVTSGNTTLSSYLGPLVQNLPVLTGLASFLVAILAGIKYISAADNEKEIKNANTQLTYALIGLVLSVAAFAITRLIFSVGGGAGIF